MALAHQSREELAELQEELGDRVILLADPDGQAISAFGMLDPDPVPPRPMARAGIFLVDRRGMVAERWLTDRYHHRPPVERILAALP